LRSSSWSSDASCADSEDRNSLDLGVGNAEVQRDWIAALQKVKVAVGFGVALRPLCRSVARHPALWFTRAELRK
jgi:hypothetical protein